MKKVFKTERNYYLFRMQINKYFFYDKTVSEANLCRKKSFELPLIFEMIFVKIIKEGNYMSSVSESESSAIAALASFSASACTLGGTCSFNPFVFSPIQLISSSNCLSLTSS